VTAPAVDQTLEIDVCSLRARARAVPTPLRR